LSCHENIDHSLKRNIEGVSKKIIEEKASPIRYRENTAAALSMPVKKRTSLGGICMSTPTAGWRRKNEIS